MPNAVPQEYRKNAGLFGAPACHITPLCLALIMALFGLVCMGTGVVIAPLLQMEQMGFGFGVALAVVGFLMALGGGIFAIVNSVFVLIKPRPRNPENAYVQQTIMVPMQQQQQQQPGVSTIAAEPPPIGFKPEYSGGVMASQPITKPLAVQSPVKQMPQFQPSSSSQIAPTMQQPPRQSYMQAQAQPMPQKSGQVAATSAPRTAYATGTSLPDAPPAYDSIDTDVVVQRGMPQNSGKAPAQEQARMSYNTALREASAPANSKNLNQTSV